MIASGTVPMGLYWEIDDSGKITITGSGQMIFVDPVTYEPIDIPWADYMQQITAVEIDGPQNVASSAFRNATNITKATFSDSCVNIQSRAFQGCRLLRTVSFGNALKFIGLYAFSGCNIQNSVNGKLPTTIENINDYAFSGNTNLTADLMDFSDSGLASYTNLTYIGNYAYNGVQTSIQMLTIPDNAKMGVFAFNNCIGVEAVSIGIASEVIPEGVFNNCVSISSVTFKRNATTRIIDVGAFQNCTSLTGITLPSTLQEIRASAFYRSGLVNLTVPNSVTYLGYACFSNSRLQSVTLSTGLTFIPDECFLNTPLSGDITIPNNVTYIGESAFRSTLITSLTAGQNLTRIYRYAFQDCYSFRMIVNGLGSTGVTTVETGTFKNCTSFTGTDFNNITSIEPEAFQNTAITGFGIMHSGTTIYRDAFADCSQLNTAYIEAGNTIDTTAFKNNSNDVTINDYVNGIAGAPWGTSGNIFWIKGNLIKEFGNTVYKKTANGIKAMRFYKKTANGIKAMRFYKRLT